MVTRCKTVGELKAALKDYPDDMPLKSYGVDCGGYDAIITDHVETETSNFDGRPHLFVSGENQDSL